MIADALTSVVLLRGVRASPIVAAYRASAAGTVARGRSLAVQLYLPRSGPRCRVTPMSRAHERAYRLLAERVRLRAPARYALYATLAALMASGAWWLVAHYGAGPFPRAVRRPRCAPARKASRSRCTALRRCWAWLRSAHASFNTRRADWTLARNRGSGAAW